MKYTKAMRAADFFRRMNELGFTYEEADNLRLIELRLQRWSEKECGTDNGGIERDEATNKPYWVNAMSGRRYPVRDMEAGALRRLNAIMAQHPDLWSFHQGDPRGCALYIGRKADLREGEAGKLDSYYSSRGVAVCTN